MTSPLPTRTHPAPMESAQRAGVGIGAPRARELARSLGVVLVAAVLFAIFAGTHPAFATGPNIRNILMQVSVVGVVAIGETMVMLTGGIDLSVGSTVLLSSVVMSDLAVRHGWPVGIAIVVGLVVGLMVGVVNGAVAVGLGIEPIIVTLGTLLAAAGMGQVLLNNSWITVHQYGFTVFAIRRVLGLPLMVWVMLGLYASFAVVMHKTGLGRSIYAVGGNRAAARLAGLPVRRRLIAVYALCGLLAGAAGLLQVGQLGIISQNNGSGMEFTAIMAVLVGGLSVQVGGVGSVVKTLVGAVIAGMISNYLVLLQVPGSLEQAAVGGLILVAVVVDHYMRSRT